MTRNRALTLCARRIPHGIGAGVLPWAAALALVLALAACGPGVGGSGTGPDLATFGASAAAVCGAPFAPALSCTDSMSTPQAQADGMPQQFVDRVNGSQVVASVRGNDIELDLRCPRLYFYGSWGTTPGGVSRYFGGYSLAGALPLSPAQVAVASDSAGLVVQLLDASGAALTAPVRLRPAQGSATSMAQGCP